MRSEPASRASEIESLYQEHAPALLLFATTIARDRARAQDVVQQVFLRMIERGIAPDIADVKAYLFTWVHNAALNEAKLHRRSMELDEFSAWFTPPDRDYAAEHNLRRALSQLPQEQCQVLVLHVWGELTFAEIANILEINASTAASRYRYALDKLRQAICAKEGSCADSRR